MRKRAVITHSMLAGAIAGLAASTALAADRANATIDCKTGTETLLYDCIIRLNNARTLAPLDQATVRVGADMPSMPMAHNVRPVIAEATGAPGEYRARIKLEMFGDWAMRLQIAGPLRDQLVVLKSFSETGSGPPSKAGRPRAGGHKH